MIPLPPRPPQVGQPIQQQQVVQPIQQQQAPQPSFCARVIAKSISGCTTGIFAALATSAFDKDNIEEVWADIGVSAVVGAIFGGLGECISSVDCCQGVVNQLPDLHKKLLSVAIKHGIVGGAAGLIDGIIAAHSQGKNDVNILKNCGVGVLTGLIAGFGTTIEVLGHSHS